MSMLDGALAFARQAVEATFDSECRVTRDPEGADDDTFDPVTWTIGDPAPGDAVLVYEGRCRLAPAASLSVQDHPEGGQPIFQDRYAAKVPVTTVLARTGDTLTVLASTTDPQLVGAVFTVDQVVIGSSSVTRILHLTRRQRGRAS